MTTAVYIRVSTSDQLLSVGAQERACLKYADALDLATPRLYTDIGVSGVTPLRDRPAGAQLRADMAAGELGAVVAVRLDRLFRDCADALHTVRDWDHAGAALHLLDMGGTPVDTSSPGGRLMLTLLSGMAEFERSLIAERTAAALAEKRARGEYTGGVVPWGYRVEGGKLFTEPTELALVQVVEAARAAGESWRKLATRINGGNYPSNRGRPWRHETLIRRVGRYQKRGAL